MPSFPSSRLADTTVDAHASRFQNAFRQVAKRRQVDIHSVATGIDRKLGIPCGSGWFQNLRFILAAITLLTAVACTDRAQKASELGQAAASQLQNDQIQLARESIKSAIASRDDDPDLYLLSGRIELRAEAYASAFSAYNNVLALDPNNAEALQAVAQLGLRTSNLRASEAAVDKLLIMNPQQVDILILKGVQLLVRKRTGEAVAIADRILAIEPLNEAGTILKARALYEQGRAEEGLDLLLAIDPQTRAGSEAMALTLLEFYRERNDAQHMMELFALIKRFRPTDINVRIDEANARYKLEQPDAARSLVRWALGRNDLSVDQAESLTRLWSEYDERPLDPSSLKAVSVKVSADIRLILARYFVEKGQNATALTILANLEGDSVRALRARVHVLTGAVQTGLDEASAILEHDTNQCDALIAKADALQSIGDTMGSIEAAQLASATCPKMLGAHVALIDSYSRRGDAAAVNRAFGDALTQLPQNSALARRFATWLEARREPSRAIAVARRLTNKAPALVSGWALLRDLCRRADAQDCAADAQQGLKYARARLAIDLEPGEDPARGLFGRLER